MYWSQVRILAGPPTFLQYNFSNIQRKDLIWIYKEKIAKIEQEKLVQIEVEIKLEEEEREIRLEEL